MSPAASRWSVYPSSSCAQPGSTWTTTQPASGTCREYTSNQPGPRPRPPSQSGRAPLSHLLPRKCLSDLEHAEHAPCKSPAPSPPSSSPPCSAASACPPTGTLSSALAHEDTSFLGQGSPIPSPPSTRPASKSPAAPPSNATPLPRAGSSASSTPRRRTASTAASPLRLRRRDHGPGRPWARERPCCAP